MNQRELMMEIDGPNGLLNRSKSKRMKHRPVKGKEEIKLFGIICAVSLSIGYLISVLPYQDNPQIGEPVSAAEVQSVPAPTINPELPPPSVDLGVDLGLAFDTEKQESSNSEKQDPNSYQNFDTAKQVVGLCQENANCMDQVRRWETAGYDATTVIRMILIFNKESGWQYDQVSTNTNGSRDVGLAQINTGWHCGKVGQPRNSQACIDALLDPDNNTRVAMELFDTQGWTPWVARKAYLPEFWADRVTL